MISSRPAVLTADRSLPRKSIVMVMHPGWRVRSRFFRRAMPVPEPIFPETKNWARIATIVDEFSCEQNAESAFRKQFMQDESALRKRLSFVIAPDSGAPISWRGALRKAGGISGASTGFAPIPRIRARESDVRSSHGQFGELPSWIPVWISISTRRPGATRQSGCICE